MDKTAFKFVGYVPEADIHWILVTKLSNLNFNQSKDLKIGLIFKYCLLM